VNYYELLNIERSADGNEIKRAYFSAVKEHPPDSDPEAFKAIRTAYETLSDQKKRAEYDSFFAAADNAAISAGLQNELLNARELIRENKYKQAEELLNRLDAEQSSVEQNSGVSRREVKRLLAEVFWRIKKTVTADKLCGELLEAFPSDDETLLLRARIANSRGHREKAGVYLKEAVRVSPRNRRAWTELIEHSLKNDTANITGVFQSAMEQDEDMFCDDYVKYLVGVKEANLFTKEKYLLYYDKFAEFYINDKNPDEDIFFLLMAKMPDFIDNNELIPFVEKILPTLEKSRQQRESNRGEDYDTEFKFIRAAVVHYNLDRDKRIHGILVDLTYELLIGDSKKEQQEMECYIAFNMPDLRPSIKVLMNEYPDCFKLNQTFYLDVLNDKKTDYLIDKYTGIFRKITPTFKNKPNDDHYENFDDDDWDEADDVKTVVRAIPKTGRNDPCPCGSGKKYKKCCGR
jgi:curved DNA-binding protein CbpA